MDFIAFSSSNLSIILVFILIFLICYFYMKPKVNLPPGPKGLPFIGSIFWFVGNLKKGIPLHKASCELRKTYGDVVMLKTPGGGHFVLLNGYDVIHDAFVNNADVLSNRPSWLPNLKEAVREGKGIVWQSDQPWKVLRKFVLQTLRDFGVGKNTLEEKVMDEVDAVTEAFNKTEGEPTDVSVFTSMMITNVIYGVVFAKRFDYEDKKLHEIIEKMTMLFNVASGSNPMGQAPLWLMKLINKKVYNGRVRHTQTLAWLKEHVYQEIENHESTFDNENIRDFCDLYIQARNDKTDETIFNKGNIFRVILDLFIAGSETTSSTINWCVLHLQEYPEIQAKCQQELSEKVGNRVVTWADRGSFPYTEATLLEIQRIANIAPFTLPHTNEVETTIGGYYIPWRSIVMGNLYSSNMDPKYWNQPEIFNPERFLDDGKLKKMRSFIPFSIGPRVCLGESLAKMEMFLIFTNLLQRFKFTREDENIKHTFGNIRNRITMTPLPYKTRAVKRT